MRLLLDTHVFLWWRLNDRRLKKPARQAIASAERVLVSAASAWEAAIKIALGRLTLKDSFEELVEKSGFDELPIEFAHAEELSLLPLHHHDPFDRMLVAQARVEGLTIVTHDRLLEPYKVRIVWT